MRSFECLARALALLSKTQFHATRRFIVTVYYMYSSYSYVREVMMCNHAATCYKSKACANVAHTLESIKMQRMLNIVVHIQ